MPQILDYPSIAGKTWEWHLELLESWLKEVQAGTSERRLGKWLRARRVFERAFIEHAQRLLGVVRGAGPNLELDEVGLELAEELARAAQAREERRASVMAQARGHSRRAPGAVDAEAVSEAFKAPTAGDDPFVKALLERFAELNPYLCRFALKEVGDDFLAPTELFRRMGTADFAGRRPSMPQFQGWLTWMEWMGGLRKVGFRHKATPAGVELFAWLKELPVEELLAAEPEPEPPASPAATPPAAGASGPGSPALVARAPGQRRVADDGDGGEDGDDAEEVGQDDELLAEEEGLDLPPEAPPAPVSDDRDGEGPDTEAPLPATAARSPAPAPSPAPSPAPLALPPLPAPTPILASQAAPRARTEPAAPAAQRGAWVHAWLDGSDAPLRGLTVDVSDLRAGRTLGLFKLLALASLVEGGEPLAARRVFEGLERTGALEAMLVAGRPLEVVLEAAAEVGASPALEERLVHLVRYRRALLALPPATWTEPRGARALLRVVRDLVAGPSLGSGLLLVLRELARGMGGGLGPDDLPISLSD